MARKPQTKKELLQAIEHEWDRLLKVAEALTDAQMVTPDAGGWSPKDNLAHLAEWMNILMGYHMDRRPAHRVMGVPAAVTRGWDMAVINPVLYARNKDRSRRAVLSRLKRTYGRLSTKLKATAFSQLMKPRYADDPQQRPLLVWVLGNTTEHFREHRRTIQRSIA